MFYEYLWNIGPDKIKRTVVVQNYQDGCLRMINVDIFIKTLKLTWLRRILLKDSRYSDFLFKRTFRLLQIVCNTVVYLLKMRI